MASAIILSASATRIGVFSAIIPGTSLTSYFLVTVLSTFEPLAMWAEYHYSAATAGANASGNFRR
jgi:hypothetical protein